MDDFHLCQVRYLPFLSGVGWWKRMSSHLLFHMLVHLTKSKTFANFDLEQSQTSLSTPQIRWNQSLLRWILVPAKIADGFSVLSFNQISKIPVTSECNEMKTGLREGDGIWFLSSRIRMKRKIFWKKNTQAIKDLYYNSFARSCFTIKQPSEMDLTMNVSVCRCALLYVCVCVRWCKAIDTIVSKQYGRSLMLVTGYGLSRVGWLVSHSRAFRLWCCLFRN